MLTSVQCLRGFAALLVVLFHVVMFSNGDSLERTGGMILGNAGVDIFFVISGFVMWVSTCNVRRTPLEFWRDRIIRIVPLYYILTAAFIAALFFLDETVVTMWDVVMSYMFIPGVNSVNGEPVPILGVGWTLNYEMMFYLIFGLVLLAPRRFRIGLVSIVFFALALGRFILPADAGVLLRITSPLWFEFLAGMLIGVLFVSGRLALSPRAFWMAGGGAMVLAAMILIGLYVAFPELPRTLAYGIPATCLVLGAICMEPVFRGVAWAGFRWLGDVSYSLYLAHGIWIFLLRHIELRFDSSILFALALVGSIAVGSVLYYGVERPVTDYLRQMVRRGRLGAPVQA